MEPFRKDCKRQVAVQKERNFSLQARAIKDHKKSRVIPKGNSLVAQEIRMISLCSAPGRQISASGLLPNESICFLQCRR
jgi:hypothetical protein